jgi:hypothetical protein
MIRESIKTISIFILTITINFNFAFGQSTINDDASKTRVTTMGNIGDVLFAGTTSKGVYRSVDGGNKWEPINNGINQIVPVIGMATSEKKIFALFFSKYTNISTLYVSSDNGLSWKEVKVCPGTNSYGLAYNTTGITSFKNKLFAATINGMYESIDDGANWTLIPEIIERDITSVVSTNDRILFWSRTGGYSCSYYTSTDGIKWNLIPNIGIPLEREQLYIHGSNFSIAWCQHTEYREGGKIKNCLRKRLFILSKNGKKWEDMDKIKPREFVFIGNDIYAITVKVTSNKEKKVVYERQILMLKDSGKSWTKVDENSDAVVVSNYDMQEKLTELKVWEPIEIEEYEYMLKQQKISAEKLAAAELKAEEEKRKLNEKFVSTYQRSGTGMSTGPQKDYRALSNDRFNSMHNTKSYIDSRGGMHIR